MVIGLVKQNLLLQCLTTKKQNIFRSFSQFLGPLNNHILNQSMNSHSTSINSSVNQSSNLIPSTPPSLLSNIQPSAWSDHSYITKILSDTNHLATSTKSLPSPIVRPSSQQQQSNKISSTPRLSNTFNSSVDQSSSLLLQNQSIQFGSISNVFLATPDLFSCRTELPKRTISLNQGLNASIPTPSPLSTFSTTSSVPNLCPDYQHQSQNYPQIPTGNIGMVNIPQWLKSLRLHKYNWIFSTISYESMLSITDDYLMRLNITKGARDKLMMCIGKLKERFGMLCQMEEDIRMHRVPLGTVLDELQKIVVTPMKPIQTNSKEDIGRQLMNIFHLGKYF